MPEPLKLVRIPSLKTVVDFRTHVASLGLDLPCEDRIVTGGAVALGLVAYIGFIFFGRRPA